VRINGIELPQLHWREALETQGIAAVVKMTRGGVPYIWEQAQQGRKITLYGAGDVGWMLYQYFIEVMDLASYPWATYALEGLYGRDLMARFRHEEPPAVSGKLVMPHVDLPGAVEWVNEIEIKLMEV